MKVLVTSAGEMGGSHLLELLHYAGHDVIGIWQKNIKNKGQITLPFVFVQYYICYGFESI